MRKKSLLFLLAAGALALTGCQSGSDSTYSKYVTLGDYTGLTIDRVTVTVTDDDVQSEIESNLYYSAEYNEVTDRAAQEGDTVNIDYTGTIDGEEFDGGSDTDYDLELGSGEFLEDFESALVGMETGETKSFEVTFPEDYDGTLDGQTAEFSVTVNSITETIVPDYDDDWVAENTDYTTTEEYEAALKQELQDYYDEDSDYTAEVDTLSEVVSNATFDGYPEDLYDTTKAQLESENEEFAEMFGMEVEDLLGEDYDIDTDVLDSIHEKLVVYAIAEKEKLEVTDDEYDTFVDDYYETYGYESADDFIADYTEEAIQYELLYEKVLDFLKENNNFEDVSEEEYYGEEVDEEELEEELSDEEETGSETETDASDAEAAGDETTAATEIVEDETETDESAEDSSAADSSESESEAETEAETETAEAGTEG